MSHSLLQTMVDAAYHPMAVVDDRFRVVVANRLCNDLIFGCNEAVAGRSLTEVVSDRSCVPRLTRELEPLLSEERADSEFEIRLCQKGEIVAVGVHAKAAVDDAGRRRAIVSLQVRSTATFDPIRRLDHPSGPAQPEVDLSITPRRSKMQAQLRASERRFRDLADAVPQIIWIAGPDGAITEINAKAAEYSGFSEEDLKGWSWLRAIHPDDRDHAVSEWRETIRHTAPRDVEFRIRRRDGEYRWHINRQFPVRDEVGRVTNWYGSCTDVEDLKRAEAKLRDERTLLRNIIDAIPDVVYTKDAWGRFQICNRATLDFYGCKSEADLAGKTARDLFPDEVARDFLADEQRVVGGGLVERELVARNSRGVDECRLMMKAPLRDHSGAIVGLVAISRNIQARKEREQRLAESRERLQLALTAARMGTWDWDLRTDAVVRSPELFAILGVESLPETNSAFDEFVHPDDRVRATNAYSDAVAARSDVVVDYRIIRRDGECRWVSEIGRVHCDATGEPVRMIGVIQDVTDRHLSEEAVRRSQSMLQQVLDNIPQAVLWKDRNHRFVWSNNVAARMLGFAGPAEMVGRSDADVAAFTPEQFESYLAKDRMVMEADAPHYHFLETTTAPDGRTVWLDTSKMPIHDAAGKVSGVLAIWDDVTERLEAELRLREERDRLTTLAEAVPGAICSFRRRPDGSVSFPYASPKVVDFYGIDPSELQVDGSLVFDCLHPDDIVPVQEQIEKSAAEMSQWNSTYRVRRPDGKEIWVEGHSTPVREPDGSILWHGIILDVSERKKAEAELRVQHAMLKWQSEASPDGVLVLDSRFGVVSRNSRFGEVWQVPREVLECGDDMQLMAFCQSRSADPNQIATHMATIAANPEARTQDEIQLIDGRTLDRYSGPIRGADGEWLGRVWYFHDITARKAAENTIRESEERYRRLVEVLPSALFIHSIERIVYCNRAFVELVGARSQEELLGRDPFELLDPRFHSRILARIGEMRNTGEASSGIEIRVRRLDGRTAPVFSATTPISGVGSNTFLVALSDLTEREQSMQLLRTVMESVNDAIITIDERGTVQSTNSAVSRMFGYASSEIVGGNVSKLMPARHGEGHDQYIRNYLDSGRAKVIGAGREVEAQRKDGTTFPVELTITEFQLDGERRFTGVLRDITSRKRLEAQFQQAQKMEAVGRLAGGVAHDFNNLLTIINGYSEMLLENLARDDAERSYLVEIHKAGVRSAGLTRQLLAFSRQQILSPRLIDLNEVVGEMLRMLSRLIGEDVTLVTDLQPGIWPVLADQGQMEQVLVNLAVNSRDAMPDGGRLTIETRNVETSDSFLRSQDDHDLEQHVQISVSDTGCGMTPEVRARVFEPFFTTKGPGSGTGLGLATVYGIIRQSGGNISVRSEPGVGTTMTIYLPRAGQTSLTSRPASKATSPRGAETVLIVEDEAGVRMLARKVLEAAGYRVLDAKDGADAERVVEAHRGNIDLLVCDVVMPGVGGRVVAERISAVHPEIRVLYMSGYTDDAIVRQGIMHEKVNFLQKPFSPVSFAIKVREVLDSRQ